MLRILIVEDEPNKKQLLVQAIKEADATAADGIQCAGNVRDAKKLLIQFHFDLLVLDINIPMSADRGPEVGAGISILRFVRDNKKAIAPSYIFGLTAYDDGFSVAVDEFQSALWKLMRFSYTDGNWKHALKAAVDFLVVRSGPPYVTDGRSHHCDVGIAVALDEEMRSLLRLPGNWVRVEMRHDNATYYKGSVVVGDIGRRTLVAVCAPRMGLTNMAITATKLVNAFHPRILSSVGICAGVREKTRIGDIVVADPCFDWGSGKWTRQNGGDLRFLPAPYQWRLDGRLGNVARELAGNLSLLRAIGDAYSVGEDVETPRVLIDAMASGASVLQVESAMRELIEHHKNLVAVDMENYAVFASAEAATEPRPDCITVKAVSDFGDEKKSEKYRGYAMHTSMMFLWNLIQHPKTFDYCGDDL